MAQMIMMSFLGPFGIWIKSLSSGGMISLGVSIGVDLSSMKQYYLQIKPKIQQDLSIS